ncbi:MAG: methylmalonyl Co-A mutase-associated GTPase MeaB [Ignavibacteriae bacterium]|nr:methylmalonyl Co-A mutase-associated GTPase MeaB [Ignavibacteriota bacterium]
MEDLTSKILSGDKRAIAKAISYVENEIPHSTELLKRLYARTGKAYRIGITGPPGAGKSTITNCLIKLLFDKGYNVGVIAVDPTSPFTGGALLGDRVRMSESGMLKNVFIRSMATRGSLGGLCKNVTEACDILDASGKDFILIETVGVGQSELDIAQTADTTIVVLVPESGDSVQAMKAGLMEIADIFVMNKADRDGADRIVSTLKNILHLKEPVENKPEIKVLKTVGIKNEGIEELFSEILHLKNNLEKTGMLKNIRKEHLHRKILDLVNNRLHLTFWDEEKKRDLAEKIDEIAEKKSDPWTYTEKITG